MEEGSVQFVAIPVVFKECGPYIINVINKFNTYRFNAFINQDQLNHPHFYYINNPGRSKIRVVVVSIDSLISKDFEHSELETLMLIRNFLLYKIVPLAKHYPE